MHSSMKLFAVSVVIAILLASLVDARHHHHQRPLESAVKHLKRVRPDAPIHEAHRQLAAHKDILLAHQRAAKAYASGRRMEQLQKSANLGGNTCNQTAYYLAMNEFSTACPYFFQLFNNASYDFEGTCAPGGCNSKFIALTVAQNDCMNDGELAIVVRSAPYFCRRGSTGNYCLRWMALNDDKNDHYCSSNSDLRYNRNACRSAQNCTWNSEDSQCEFNEAIVSQRMCSDRVCANMMFELSAANGDMPPAMGQAYLNMVCSTHGSTRCYPLIIHGFERICNDNVAYQCSRAIMTHIKTFFTLVAENSYMQCVKGRGNVTSSVNSCCKPVFDGTYTVVKSMDAEINRGCARNGNGEWCQDVMDRYSESFECGQAVMANRTCNGDCPRIVSDALADMGCCFGNMYQLLEARAAPIPASAYPTYTARQCMSDSCVTCPNEGDQMDDEGITAAMMKNGENVCPSMTSARYAQSCPSATSIALANPCFSAEFHTDIQAFEAACNFSNIDLEGNTPAATNAKLATFCSSACYTAIQTAIGKWSRCFKREDVKSFEGMVVGCRKPEGSADYCYTTLQRAGEMECDDLQESQCKAKSLCIWSTSNDGESQCEINPSDAYLGSVCNNSCIGDLAATMGEEGVYYGLWKKMLCPRLQNRWCYPIASAVWRANGVAGFTTAQLDGVCDSSLSRRCTRTLGTVYGQVMRSIASQTLRSCQQQTSGGSAMMPRSKQLAKRGFKGQDWGTCVRAWAQVTRWSLQYEAVFKSLCVKNVAKEYCNAQWKTVRETGACIGDEGCSANCSANMSTATANGGCCWHIWNAALGGFQLSKYIPRFAQNDNMRSEVAAIDISDGKGVKVITLCNGFTDSTVSSNLNKRCVFNFTTRNVTKASNLPIVYYKLKQDPTLRQKVIDALVDDTATSLLVRTEDIQNPRLEENTAIQINVDNKAASSSSSRRSMKMLSTASGTSFKFDLRAETEAEVNAVSAEFDAMSSRGGLALPEATAVVFNDCPSCLDSSSTSLAPVKPMPAPQDAGGGAPPASDDSKDFETWQIALFAAAGGIALIGVVVGAIIKGKQSNKEDERAASGLAQPMNPMPAAQPQVKPEPVFAAPQPAARSTPRIDDDL